MYGEKCKELVMTYSKGRKEQKSKLSTGKYLKWQKVKTTCKEPIDFPSEYSILANATEVSKEKK
jgi:hypothetical protein